VTLEADFKEFGWTKVENVECLWRLETAKSDALLGTIVDDLLFTESTGYASTDATIDFLRKKYSGVKAEHEPSSFAGYKIETSADLSVCTLSMPITTSKCAELTVFIREAARGMGILDNKPTVIRSDNASSVRVANDPKAAGRLRHAMRRYSVLQEHVKQGVVRVEFIRDANNAADFLTKWVPAAKLKASIAYTSNEAAKPKKQAKTEISTLEVSMIEEEGTFMTMRSGKRSTRPHLRPSACLSRCLSSTTVSTSSSSGKSPSPGSSSRERTTRPPWSR
jgi:PAS domain-containing protein